MKKFLPMVVAVLLLICLITAAGVYFYKSRPVSKSIESFLPQNAAAYLRFSDISGRIERLKLTDLWDNVSNINIEMLLEKSGLSQADISIALAQRDQVLGFISDLFLDKFFGEEIAVALYPVSLELDNINPMVILESLFTFSVNCGKTSLKTLSIAFT